MTPFEKIKLCANGNDHAEQFMVATYNYLHAVDDVFDKDEPYSQEEFCKSAMNFTMHIALNPFFQQHKERLLTLLEQSIAAWIDSDKPEYKQAQFVLKRQYHEIFWQCARLTGGWTFMRDIQSKHRYFEQ